MSKGWMYILECADGSYYTGSTNNLERRLEQHQAGEGANHTKKRLPVKVVYLEAFEKVDIAFKREKQVQGWSREKKEALINNNQHKLPELAKCLNDTSHVGFDSAQPTVSNRSKNEETRSLSGVETNGAPPSHLVPRLRFPEFEKEGEWVEKAISKLGEIINGLNGKKGVDFGGGKPYVQYKQVFNKSYVDFSECGKVSVSDDEHQNTLQKGDILFTTSSETSHEAGFASVIINHPNEPTYLNSFCFILRPFDLGELKPGFSRYLFHSPIYRKSVTIIAQGSTRFNLSKSSFLKLKLPVPNDPQEQQKIAACLSSLDQMIAAHSDRLQALRDHKKGLMQNLFPQQGQKVPNYRFPEFEKEGEWVEKALGEIAEIVRGGSPRPIQEYLTIDNDGLNWLKIADVSSDSKYITGTKEKVIQEAINSTREVNQGDLILSNSMSFGRPYILKIKTCIHDGWIAIRKISNTTFEDYLYYFISSESSQKYFQVNAAGAAVKNLNAEIIKLLSICLPKNKEEQHKIASCLSSLDESIAAQAEKIAQLKKHKKGLMQGLFPERSRGVFPTTQSLRV